MVLESDLLKARHELALIAPRAAIGASMLMHGASKLSAEGSKRTAGMFEQLGITPGRPWALATGAAEAFAGVSAILGVLTRPAALAVIVTQAVAIAKVHGQKGFDITKGGFEYNAALIAIALGLLIAGPGVASTHELIERGLEGRGARKLWSRARPSIWLRLVKLLK